ncbi:TPA: hypothetical protein M2P40_004686 [Klebsiella pneumoniae]|nr:hypothetical protein [Klebsiella pneumoniae]HDK6593993.1 hypothetical protein [Klebsiella pneumoniae]
MTTASLTKAELKVIAETDHVQCGDASIMALQLLDIMNDQPASVTSDDFVIVPKELTPDKIRAIQLNSEIGRYITTNWSDAYAVLQELWTVAIAPTAEK